MIVSSLCCPRALGTAIIQPGVGLLLLVSCVIQTGNFALKVVVDVLDFPRFWLGGSREVQRDFGLFFSYQSVVDNSHQATLTYEPKTQTFPEENLSSTPTT
jgi:hypothetical protein